MLFPADIYLCANALNYIVVMKLVLCYEIQMFIRSIAFAFQGQPPGGREVHLVHFLPTSFLSSLAYEN